MVKGFALVILSASIFGFLMALVNGDSPRNWFKR